MVCAEIRAAWHLRWPEAIAITAIRTVRAGILVAMAWLGIQHGDHAAVVSRLSKGVARAFQRRAIGKRPNGATQPSTGAKAQRPAV